MEPFEIHVDGDDGYKRVRFQFLACGWWNTIAVSGLSYSQSRLQIVKAITISISISFIAITISMFLARWR